MVYEPIQAPNCEAWWDAVDPTADGSTLYADSQAMGDTALEWVDKVNGYLMTQGTAGARPLFKTDIVNGNSIVRFDGSDDSLEIPSDLYTIPNSDCTIVIVAKTSSTAVMQTLLGFSTAGVVNCGMRFGITGYAQGLLLALSSPVFTSTTALAGCSVTVQDHVQLEGVATDEFNVYTYRRSGTLQTFAVNNAIIATNELGTSVATVDFVSLGSTAGTSLYFNGDVGEVIIYSDNLGDVDTAELNQHLGEKWGIYVTNSFKQTTMALASDRLVKLYEIDATNVGGSIYRFTSSIDTELAIASLTSSGLIATCQTTTNHAMVTGEAVRIKGPIETSYVGDFIVTVINPTTFTYVMLGTTTSPATTLSSLSMTRLENTMVYNGNSYIPIAFEAEGFEWNGQGSLPQPRIKVSNVNKILLSAVIGVNDLLGATFTRIRTFRKFLDDGVSPDPSAIYPKEIYTITRKAVHNKIYIEFELGASIDQEGVMIPARLCLRNLCTHRYRVWDADTGAFDYTNATCPYTELASFTKTNVFTSTSSEDKCGKNLDSCRLRFGNNPLPTRAFPGIGG